MAITYINRIAPAGFHVLTEEEAQAIKSVYDSANQLKEEGEQHWLPGNEGTNESLVTLLGAGERSDAGVFDGYKEEAHIWLADEAEDDTKAKALKVTNDSIDIVVAEQGKKTGLSVR